MTPDEFNAWLAAMKAASLIRFDVDAARALGVTVATLQNYKDAGVPSSASRRTGLACAALLAGLRPWCE